MAKRVAVIQSSYIPWKGYFDIIHDVDLFVFYDCVQFTKNDWRNRNKIKGPEGERWLSIPVGKTISRLIHEVELPEPSWKDSHLMSMKQSYRRAPFFKEVFPHIEDIYKSAPSDTLSRFNRASTERICREFLGIGAQFASSLDYGLEGKKEGRLESLLTQVGTTHYVSGPSARSYLNADSYKHLGISVEFKDYDYPTYKQLSEPFTHAVSIVDLLFNLGPGAGAHIWHKAQTESAAPPAPGFTTEASH